MKDLSTLEGKIKKKQRENWNFQNYNQFWIAVQKHFKMSKIVLWLKLAISDEKFISNYPLKFEVPFACIISFINFRDFYSETLQFKIFNFKPLAQINFQDTSNLAVFS